MLSDTTVEINQPVATAENVEALLIHLRARLERAVTTGQAVLVTATIGLRSDAFIVDGSFSLHLHIGALPPERKSCRTN
jgi:hypothetical protein